MTAVSVERLTGQVDGLGSELSVLDGPAAALGKDEPGLGGGVLLVRVLPRPRLQLDGLEAVGRVARVGVGVLQRLEVRVARVAALVHERGRQ